MSAPRVLVVDDDPDILEYVSSFLEDHGYEVAVASRASSALAALDSSPPDAMLLDVLLPGRSGLKLLTTIRRDRRYADLPVVVVTGNDRLLEDDCQSYIGSHDGIRGPDGVLGKPIDRDALLRILAHLLDRQALEA
jgi:CheY-like chemotaxis protein